MTTYDLHKKFTPEEVDALYQQVISLLAVHKKYKDPKFDSSQLAKALHLNEHELTFLLKNRFHCNFSRLLNRYRLEEMCYMLKHPQWAERSILEIAYAVGFYNRQTYCTIFRKATGLSPRAYRKLYQMDWKGQVLTKKTDTND